MAPELAERWRRAVPSLKESGLRAAFMRSELARAPAESAACALDELCGDAEQADPVAREVLGAAMPSLTDPGQAEWVETLRQLAHKNALLPLGRLLRRRKAGAEGSLPPADPDARPVGVSREGRPLTLGERKALARRPSRALIDRLLRDPHPAVIRALLVNPRLTEDDVVRLAARRPAYPDVIVEIAQSPAWVQRPRVRMAIIQNPGSPPEIAVPMLPLLIRPELVQLLGAADVAPVIRASATDLLQRRPPPPASRSPMQ